MAFAKFKQCVDQLVKRGPKLTSYDADICAEIIEGIWQYIINTPRWILVSEHQVTMLPMLQTDDEFLEVRQVFASPL